MLKSVALEPAEARPWLERQPAHGRTGLDASPGTQRPFLAFGLRISLLVIVLANAALFLTAEPRHRAILEPTGSNARGGRSRADGEPGDCLRVIEIA